MLVCPNDHGPVNRRHAKFCPECGAELVEQRGPIRTTIYIHGDKDTNYNIAEWYQLDADAKKTFSYTALEVCLAVEINPQTGETRATGIMVGDEEVKLDRPIIV